MRTFRPVLLAAAASLLADAATAQTYAASAAAPPASRETRRADWRARREAHESREVADLSTVLRLRPDQQTGLRAWLDAGRPGPGARGEPMRSDPNAAAATTPQVLDRETARMAERDGRVRNRLEATRRFYAELGPDQQAVFDALQRLRHDHGRRHGGWGRGGGDHGGMGMGRRGPGGPMGGDEAPPPPRAGD